jgi:hypothetical protein
MNHLSLDLSTTCMKDICPWEGILLCGDGGVVFLKVVHNWIKLNLCSVIFGV